MHPRAPAAPEGWMARRAWRTSFLIQHSHFRRPPGAGDRGEMPGGLAGRLRPAALAAELRPWVTARTLGVAKQAVQEIGEGALAGAERSGRVVGASDLHGRLVGGRQHDVSERVDVTYLDAARLGGVLEGSPDEPQAALFI